MIKTEHSIMEVIHMKEKYTAPEMEIIEFDTDDVIVTSEEGIY